jgi:dienelactone hydrolase
MGRATVTEARALLAWGRARYERIGVAGYSMGGQMAAMTAALCPWPVRFAGVATSVSPARVFFDGPLRSDVASAPLGEGGLSKLRVIMERLNVLDLDPPCDVEHAVLVGTRADAIVPPSDTGAIARHWGVHPRWINEGHMSTVIFRPHAMAQAVVDAFA